MSFEEGSLQVEVEEEAPARAQPCVAGPRIRRALAAGLALGVFAAGAAVAWQAFHPERSGERGTDELTVAPSPSAFEQLPAGWTELPSPPEARAAPAEAWTGDRLLIWGGFVYTGYSDEEAKGDGFAFDARAGTWEPISPSPLAARVSPASEWTGEEMLVWGGSDLENKQVSRYFGDGAAYDPRTDTWRNLPPAPLSPRAPMSVWTSRELIVWGTAHRLNDRPRDGAAYDPATNSWRTIAEAPIEVTDATAVWTGQEMIVFGAALHGGNFPESETAIGAAYHPATDTWRRLPDSELSPQASTAAWNGREMVAWDDLHGTAAYDPAGESWRRLPKVPLENRGCCPQSVAVGGYVFGTYTGQMTLFDPLDDSWHDISRPDLTDWGFQLVAADPAVLLLGRDVETKEVLMLAYRPSAPTPRVPAPADEELRESRLVENRSVNDEHAKTAVGSEATGALTSTWGGWLLWGDSLTTTITSGETHVPVPEGLSGGALSPVGVDAGIIAYRADNSGVGWSPDLGRQVELPGHDAHWMPDGSSVAVEVCEVDGCRLTLVDAFDGTVLRYLVETDEGRGFSVSPDGRNIVYTHRDGGLWTVEVGSGETSPLVGADETIASSHELKAAAGSGDLRVLSFPEWSPSGSYIAALVNLNVGYYPVVFTSEGALVGVGWPDPSSPPDLAWRWGRDELYYAESCALGCDGGSNALVLAMAAPEWTSRETLHLPGHDLAGRGPVASSGPALATSPGGHAVLVVTVDRDRLEATGWGAQGIPYRWTAIEPNTGHPLQQWDVTEAKLFDWR